MSEDQIEQEEFAYCPAHIQLISSHDRLCSKVDWIIKLMLANLFSVVLTLVTMVGGLLYYIAKG